MIHKNEEDRLRAIIWREGALEVLDQRLLPNEVCYRRLSTSAEVVRSIRNMVVRGAPAIGITAAYGVVLAAESRYSETPDRWRNLIDEDIEMLAKSRPTAINLHWALQRMKKVIAVPTSTVGRLLKEAIAIHNEDIISNKCMGRLGAALLGQRSAVLTHCNAGALATGGYGTALGVIRAGYASGLIEQVYVSETRPWLQGARLTLWELVQYGIPVKLLVDAAAGALMRMNMIRWVIVGADRIAANGDVANKIGTYQLAVAARYHDVGFMVVAPTSTFDMHSKAGANIPIEQRSRDELFTIGCQIIAEAGAWNPCFDVTPAELISVLVTEQGAVSEPNAEKIALLMSEKNPY
jgi:methylthioribose-1-phosphate isomerase